MVNGEMNRDMKWWNERMNVGMNVGMNRSRCIICIQSVVACSSAESRCCMFLAHHITLSSFNLILIGPLFLPLTLSRLPLVTQIHCGPPRPHHHAGARERGVAWAARGARRWRKLPPHAVLHAHRVEGAEDSEQGRRAYVYF